MVKPYYLEKYVFWEKMLKKGQKNGSGQGISLVSSENSLK